MILGSVTAVCSLRIRLAGSWRRSFVALGMDWRWIVILR
jgi:hypothetical protein